MGSYHWEIPVLDGFSFSQSTNSSEITLNEMSTSAGESRRGRKMFNDSLAPAEWSFSTYARPFSSAGGSATGSANPVSGKVHAVEEVLWALLVGDAQYNTTVSSTGGVPSDFAGATGVAPTLSALSGTVSLVVNGAVEDVRTVTFDSVTTTSRVGMVATINGQTRFITAVDTSANTVTFNDDVTLADDATVVINNKLGEDSTVTVNTSSDGQGTGCVLQIAYTDGNGQFSITASQPGSGYDDGDKVQASEEAIALAFGAELGRVFDPQYFADIEGTVDTLVTSSTGTDFTGVDRSTSGELNIDFSNSNKTTLGTANIYFVMGGSNSSASDHKVYKIADCVVNEASVEFDIDGITTINWSGQGSLITDENETAPSGTLISEGSTTTSNFIRNRLTSLTATSTSPTSTTYDLTLTGGSITISNNVSFLTPETLGIVNIPLGHVTGTRNVSGSFTCYLNKTGNSSGKLFENLIENKDTVTNNFDLTFVVGGDVANTPRLEFAMTDVHFEVPTHAIDDIISLESNFHALPSDVDEADELAIKYKV